MNLRSGSIPDDFIGKINYFMLTEKRYRDSELELSDLARSLGIPKRRVSKLIQSHFGTSFPSFLNDYRLREVLLRFDSQDHRKHTILAIALEAGFPSKSTFYRYFKKKLQVPPTEFLNKKSSN